MSASRDKKLRKANAPAEPLDNQNNNEEKKNEIRYRVASIVVVVTLIATLIGSIWWAVDSFILAQTMPAMQAGDEDVYDHELTYYYLNTYTNFLNQTGEYASSLFGLDSSISLKQQTYYADQTMTWHDYFLENAKNSAQQIRMLVNEAENAGVTLNAEYQELVDSELTNLTTYVTDNSEEITTNFGITISDVDTYLEVMYGERMDSAEYKRILTDTYLATQYQTQKLEELTDAITNEQIDTHYGENKADFDMVTYRRYFVSADIDETMTEEQQTAALEAAKTTAASIAAASTSETEFIAQIVEYQNQVNERVAAESEPDEDGNLPAVVPYTGADAEEETLYEDATKSSLSTDMGDWLFDDARMNGDSTSIDSTSGSYVLLFVERGRNDYNTIDVRHILVSFDEYDAEGNPIDPDAEVVEDETADETTTDTATDETVTEAQDAAAKAEAERILAEYEAGDMTEEAFAELAKQYSYDGNAADGGIYEEVFRGQMVANFETWCFGSGREYGDVGIVSTDYGYHIMFFVGENIPYWQVQVRDTMASANYTAWQESVLTNYEIKEKSGIDNVAANY